MHTDNLTPSPPKGFFVSLRTLCEPAGLLFPAIKGSMLNA